MRTIYPFPVVDGNKFVLYIFSHEGAEVYELLPYCKRHHDIKARFMSRPRFNRFLCYCHSYSYDIYQRNQYTEAVDSP
jgi:hypothetical protein